MEDMASAFSGLPYFSPMMMINTSNTSAARRILQCREMGVYQIDVTRKFQQHWSRDAVPDLSQDDFLARRQLINDVAHWYEAKDEKMEELVPILFRYEIAKMSAKRARDWGHLVWSDLTNTRFFLVMVMPAPCNCGNYDHDNYDAITKYHADRLMCLLKGLYTGDGPAKYVRATYVTAPSYQLPEDFLISLASSSDSDLRDVPKNEYDAPVYHITPANAVPSLLPSEIEEINNTLAQARKKPIPADVVAQITGSKDTKPDVSQAWKQKEPRQCSYCEKHFTKNLMQCSKCKLAHYCGPECQRQAWPAHKLFCKKAKA